MPAAENACSGQCDNRLDADTEPSSEAGAYIVGSPQDSFASTAITS
jgi:hypothetical protein